MSTTRSDEVPILSLEECYHSLALCSISAMRFHKMSNHNMYKAEIASLARFCSVLLKRHAIPVQQIMSRIEGAINKAYVLELERLNADIEHLFNKRKKLSCDTSYGEKEIAKISIQIAELEEAKKQPSKESIQNIIHDAISLASKNDSIDLPDEIYIHLFEHSATEPRAIPHVFQIPLNDKNA